MQGIAPAQQWTCSNSQKEKKQITATRQTDNWSSLHPPASPFEKYKKAGGGDGIVAKVNAAANGGEEILVVVNVVTSVTEQKTRQ